MEYAREDTEQDAKRAYEAPRLRTVHLEVRASVLSLCLSSTGVSPSLGLCNTRLDACFLAAPARSTP